MLDGKNDRKKIYIRVKPGEVDTFKVTFCFEDIYDPVHYFISKKRVEDYSYNIRFYLKELLDAYRMNGGPNNEKAQNALCEIAENGLGLHSTLFTAVGSQDKTTAASIKDWFKKHDSNHVKSKLIVMFIADTKENIPWGLTYSPPLPRNVEIDYDSFPNFWCIKHSAVVSPSPAGYPPVESKFPSTYKTKVIAILAKEIVNYICHNYYNGNEEIIQSIFAEPYNTVEELRKEWPANYYGKHQLLYLLGHSSSKMCSMGRKQMDVIDANKIFALAENYSSSEFDDIIFLFSNGCKTATGVTEDSWARISRHERIKGFIGTETEVPILFAWYFGLDFLRHALNGSSSVHCVLKKLRRDHWPLSLLYNAYCTTDLTFNPDDDLSINIPIPDKNFSNIDLGVTMDEVYEEKSNH